MFRKIADWIVDVLGIAECPKKAAQKREELKKIEQPIKDYVEEKEENDA